MSEKRFPLQPFPGGTQPGDLRLTATVGRRSNIIAIQYVLLGNLTGLAIPAPAPIPSRKNKLWEETCFEFFVAVKNSPRYWEFNLSPSGHWNGYSFEAYRQGMREEMAFTSLPFTVNRQSDSLSLDLETDLGRIVKAGQAIEVAISAVIKRQDGDVTFWALIHRGRQADFHLRDNFVVEL